MEGNHLEDTLAITTYPHIEIRAGGIPYLAGTPTKVVEIVMAHLAHEWDAAEIREQLPHLTLAQIHSALAYYYDNQREIDSDIARRSACEQESMQQFAGTEARQKLIAAKRAIAETGS